jgi:hypothetical protein
LTGSFAPAFLWHFYGFESDAFIPSRKAMHLGLFGFKEISYKFWRILSIELV